MTSKVVSYFSGNGITFSITFEFTLMKDLSNALSLTASRLSLKKQICISTWICTVGTQGLLVTNKFEYFKLDVFIRNILAVYYWDPPRIFLAGLLRIHYEACFVANYRYREAKFQKLHAHLFCSLTKFLYFSFTNNHRKVCVPLQL